MQGMRYEKVNGKNVSSSEKNMRWDANGGKPRRR